MSIAEKLWNQWKNEYEEEGDKILVISDDVFEKIEGIKKTIYVIETNISKMMEMQFIGSEFSCLKIKGPKREDYRLYIENEHFLKAFRIVCNEKIHDVMINAHKKENKVNKNITDNSLITSEDKKIVDIFYNQILNQSHYKIRNLTGSFKRFNLY